MNEVTLNVPSSSFATLVYKHKYTVYALIQTRVYKMHMEDDHFLNLFRGKRIKLSLRTASYIGVVQRINANKTLVLADGDN